MLSYIELIYPPLNEKHGHLLIKFKLVMIELVPDKIIIMFNVGFDLDSIRVSTPFELTECLVCSSEDNGSLQLPCGCDLSGAA